MYKHTVILALVIVISTLSLIKIHAEDVNPYSAQAMVSAAKVSASCAVFNKLVSFQYNAKIEDGDDLVGRFYGMELARTGKTVDEYQALCEQATKLHERHMTFLKEIGESE